MGQLSRRGFFRLTALGGAALIAGCAPLTVPPESPVVRPTPQPPALPRPLSPAGSLSTPSASAGAPWEKEWQGIVAAAEKEGRLALVTWGDAGYHPALERFQQAFPGVVVDQSAESSASVWLDHVRRGRRVGEYRWDLALVQPDWALKFGAPEGIWAPLRPLLFHPDVVEDGRWRDGFNGRFLDTGGTLCFDWEYQVQHAYAVNTDLVDADEITTVEDLLDPKWRGRVVSSDPRIGSGLLSATSVVESRGREVVRQLLVNQRPIIREGGPDLAESLAQGWYPIVMGLRPKVLQPFRDRGVAGSVRYLDLPDADFVASIALLHFDRAPHPDAARLFANWILTQEGQTALTRGLRTNSARTDVEPFEPDAVGGVGRTYFDPDREANYRLIADTQAFVRALLAATGR